MKYSNIVKTGNVLGIVSIAFFLLCMAWQLVLSEPALKKLHINLLRVAYPGFSMSFTGAVIGIVEAFIYGWFFGMLFAWLCRKLCVLWQDK